MSEDKASASIWVVEDDPQQLDLIHTILRTAHYQVQTFDNGNVMLERLKSEKPDLILLDVMMPDISGLEVLEIIRSWYPIGTLPVLLLTARTLPEDIQAGLQLDANDYVTKPYQREELLERIRIHVSVKREQEKYQYSAGTRITDFFTAVIDNIWVVLVTAVLGMAATFAIFSSIRPTYQAQSSVVIILATETGEDIGEYLIAVENSIPTIVNNYIRALESELIRDNTLSSLSGRYSADALERATVEISSVQNTMVLVIAVSSDDPILARDFANEMAIQLEALTLTPGFPEPFPIVILDDATVPTQPIAPNMAQALWVSGIASVLVGILLTQTVESIKNRRKKKTA